MHVGNVIPFDGVVTAGEAMVNQASLTGECVAGKKNNVEDRYVYAGTVVEEGEVTVRVKGCRMVPASYEKIAAMIEDSEKLEICVWRAGQSIWQISLVPYSSCEEHLQPTWLLTRNATKALAVLMVDFSCALKLAMPISVLSAIREAGSVHSITVKGGKYLEASGRS